MLNRDRNKKKIYGKENYERPSFIKKNSIGDDNISGYFITIENEKVVKKNNQKSNKIIKKEQNKEKNFENKNVNTEVNNKIELSPIKNKMLDSININHVSNIKKINTFSARSKFNDEENILNDLNKIEFFNEFDTLNLEISKNSKSFDSIVNERSISISKINNNRKPKNKKTSKIKRQNKNVKKKENFYKKYEKNNDKSFVQIKYKNDDINNYICKRPRIKPYDKIFDSYIKDKETGDILITYKNQFNNIKTKIKKNNNNQKLKEILINNKEKLVIKNYLKKNKETDLIQNLEMKIKIINKSKELKILFGKKKNRLKQKTIYKDEKIEIEYGYFYQIKNETNKKISYIIKIKKLN